MALLSDFGTSDWYVAAMKGVICSRAPGVRLVDITHEIPPQDVSAGAFTLAAAALWFPSGTVFVAVVDPGVGGRRALLAACADGHYFLGPDNGLLSVSLERAKRLRIVQLTNTRYWLKPTSRTFHGRDILAPVAAYLAVGGSLDRLGAPVKRMVASEALTRPRPPQTSPRSLLTSAQGQATSRSPGPSKSRSRRILRPQTSPSHLGDSVQSWSRASRGNATHRRTRAQGPMSRAGAITQGRVVHIDHFGNLITSVPAAALAAWPKGMPPWMRCQGRKARMVSSYVQGRSRELVAIAGSLGFIELAVRNGSAQRLLHAHRGDRVFVLPGG